MIRTSSLILSPFVHNDWNRVEVRKGEVRKAMQATAWLCGDGATIIDWQP